MNVPVLFVHNRSNYKKLPGFDCYDLERNALNFKGDDPVICHPPCRLFSRLRAFSNADIKEKQLAYFALDLVRKNGGILEHPASSLLWKEKELPLGNVVDEYGGFTLCIDQVWFGLTVRKRTYLYIVGIQPRDLPDYPILNNIPTRKFDNLTHKQRSETTVELCNFLREIILKIQENGIKNQ